MTDEAGNPVTPDGSVGPTPDGSVGPNGNPISGIGSAKEILPNTEAPGGYFEGPRFWYDAGLMFVDPTAGGTQNGILFQSLNGQAATPFRDPSNGALGSAIDNHKNLVTAESNVGKGMYGRVVRTLGDGGTQVVADTWDAGGVGAQMDSPNDLVVRKSDGVIFVTDPGYQDPDAGLNHVFVISAAGVARSGDMCTNLCRPNGIALSPDEKTLYVGFTGPFDDKSMPYIQKYTVGTDGSLSNPTKFVTVGNDLDGLATDDNGNVYAAYSAGVAVFDSTGTKWGDITVPKQPTAVAFGDADRKTLYITANAAAGPSIYTVHVNVPGRVE